MAQLALRARRPLAYQAQPRARPVAVAGRAPCRAMPRRTQAASTCAAQTALPRQASAVARAINLSAAAGPRLHRKSRFFILEIGQRRLCHQILLVALITMVCSDMADCNASSRDCKSKSGAPWRAATGCHACTPRGGGWTTTAHTRGAHAARKADTAHRLNGKHGRHYYITYRYAVRRTHVTAGHADRPAHARLPHAPARYTHSNASASG